MNTETELKIRWLLTQKEAAIAEANMELNRGGWTSGWNIVFREIDAEIEALINPQKEEKPKEEKPRMMRCENWEKCRNDGCAHFLGHCDSPNCKYLCDNKIGISGSKCVEVSP